MSNLNLLQLPREVTTLIRLRPEGLPPLQMQDGANRGAKSTLDALASDAELFGRQALANERMAGAVRGLLYLWSGWPDECAACGERLGGAEGQYIAGLAYRQKGRAEEAKSAFQQVGEHAIHVPLATETIAIIGTTADAALLRLKQLLEMVQSWEPFAFVDLYEQCRQRVLPTATERVARSIQSAEFELLMVHCLEAVLGQSVTGTQPPAVDEEARRRERKNSRRLEAAQKSQREKRRAERSRPAPAALKAPAQIKIKCPKCKTTIMVQAALRGKKTTCGKCRATFLVPTDRGAGSPPVVAGPGIGVRCPKCQHLATLSPASRGKAHTCAKCAARFLVPV